MLTAQLSRCAPRKSQTSNVASTVNSVSGATPSARIQPWRLRRCIERRSALIFTGKTVRVSGRAGSLRLGRLMVTQMNVNSTAIDAVQNSSGKNSP